MFFRSQRLFLRPGWPEDWSDLYRAVNDAQVVRNLAAAPWPYGPEDAKAYAALPQDPRYPHFLITLPDGEAGQTIGTVGLIRGEDGTTELGYWIARSHWGRGFATEAARGTLALARTLGHHRIKAVHFVDNPASGRVLRKAGFNPTGAVEQRFSQARGCAVNAQVYAAELAAPNDEGGGDDPLMQAA